MSEKCTVLHFISDTNIGGAGKYLINYCKNRNKERFEVLVALPRNSLLIPELKNTGVKIIEIEGIKDDSKDFKAYKIIKHIIDTNKPDIVHTHASIVARIAAKRAKCKPKIIYTKHCDFEPSKIYSYSIIKKLFGSFTKRYADRIIATSMHSKENLIKQGISSDIIVAIPNGTDGFKRLPIDNIKSTKAKYNIKEEKVIGYVARLVELKGHKTLFDAVKELKDTSDIKCKCLVIGDGEYKEELEKYVAENGLQNDVIFTGFIENVEEILNIVDVQVNCSYLSETTNLALLEGMSLGIPGVATNIGGTPDMIQDEINGFVVPIQDGSSMAKKLKLVLEDKELYNKMQENSTRIFNEKYTSEKFAKAIENVYDNVTNLYIVK